MGDKEEIPQTPKDIPPTRPPEELPPQKDPPDEDPPVEIPPDLQHEPIIEPPRDDPANRN